MGNITLGGVIKCLPMKKPYIHNSFSIVSPIKKTQNTLPFVIKPTQLLRVFLFYQTKQEGMHETKKFVRNGT